MHPIERLRYVARAGWAPPAVLAAEAAWALGDLAHHDQPAVLPACRRLLDRHTGCAPLWWVAARILTSGDPVGEAERCADALEDDPTSALLDEALDGRRAVRHGGVGDVVAADVVIVACDAIGPGGMVLDGDDLGLLEAARAVEVPVWVEAGVGRVLPPRLWDAMRARLERAPRPGAGVVATLDGVELVAGPTGPQPLRVALASSQCPEPPELLARS